METPRYFIKSQTLLATDPHLQDALSRVYDTPERPRCMCVSGGVPMYVAKHRHYVVKRMPDTGSQHHPSCPGYEPPAGTSGLGELLGEAVIEHSPEQIEIRVDFPFSRVPGRPIPKGEVDDPSEIHAPRRRLSLRALLHLLYERAGFNRWYPAMQGKRNQAVIHKYLGEAAAAVVVKGAPLAERLYIPEPFRSEQREEIAERRRQKLSVLQSPEDDVQYKMALVIGEFSSVESTTFGRKVLIKHMPDAPLYLDTKTWERAERAYGELLRARDADIKSKPRVLVAALIYARQVHLYQIDTLSMMLTTDQWLPLDGLYELALIERLCLEGRSFIKPLQYDAKAVGLFPNVLLTDVGPATKALHVLSSLSDPKVRAAKEKVIREEGESAWVWQTDRPMPELPTASNRPSRYSASVPTPASSAT